MAALRGAPTHFRLLNHPGARVGPQIFSIGDGTDQQMSVQAAMTLMSKVRPSGSTPLLSHIRSIQCPIAAEAPSLRAAGKRAVIVIATDGLPTDERGYGGHGCQQEFVNGLRSLEGLPVWIVIRLCTDNVEVCAFYNSLDSMLELSIDVLDDFSGEAQEVYRQNPWLNYGLPLHRMREMGCNERLVDLIDARPLTKAEIGDFCRFLFGGASFDGLPDPSLDWGAFLADVDRLLLKEEKDQWNPVKQKAMPWIDFRELGYNNQKQKHGIIGIVWWMAILLAGVLFVSESCPSLGLQASQIWTDLLEGWLGFQFM